MSSGDGFSKACCVWSTNIYISQLFRSPRLIGSTHRDRKKSACWLIAHMTAFAFALNSNVEIKDMTYVENFDRIATSFKWELHALHILFGATRTHFGYMTDSCYMTHVILADARNIPAAYIPCMYSAPTTLYLLKCVPMCSNNKLNCSPTHYFRLHLNKSSPKPEHAMILNTSNLKLWHEI
jgi:hypothetical protein